MILSLSVIYTNFFFFFFFGPHLWHMEVPRLGVQSELQLQAYGTATATLNLSHIHAHTAVCSKAGSLTWGQGLNPHPHGHYVGFLTHWPSMRIPCINFQCMLLFCRNTKNHSILYICPLISFSIVSDIFQRQSVMSQAFVYVRVTCLHDWRVSLGHPISGFQSYCVHFFFKISYFQMVLKDQVPINTSNSRYKELICKIIYF